MRFFVATLSIVVVVAALTYGSPAGPVATATNTAGAVAQTGTGILGGILGGLGNTVTGLVSTLAATLTQALTSLGNAVSVVVTAVG
uniref:Secreted protein n=2 Tax=Lutzomyia longipalpis TaxID=7200 RepID=A0A1B0CJ84_LUTLO